MPDTPHFVPNPGGSSLGMRQFEIHQLGLAGKELSLPIALAQLEREAAEVLTPPACDSYRGCAKGSRWGGEFPGGFGLTLGWSGCKSVLGRFNFHFGRRQRSGRLGRRCRSGGRGQTSPGRGLADLDAVVFVVEHDVRSAVADAAAG